MEKMSMKDIKAVMAAHSIKNDNFCEKAEFITAVMDHKRKIVREMQGCYQCGRDGASMQCSRCKSARYCGAECQRAHWKAHKPDCKKIAS